MVVNLVTWGICFKFGYQARPRDKKKGRGPPRVTAPPAPPRKDRFDDDEKIHIELDESLFSSWLSKCSWISSIIVILPKHLKCFITCRFYWIPLYELMNSLLCSCYCFCFCEFSLGEIIIIVSRKEQDRIFDVLTDV